MSFSSGKGISSSACELSFAVYLHSEWMGTDALVPSWRKVSTEARGVLPYLSGTAVIDEWTETAQAFFVNEIRYYYGIHT